MSDINALCTTSSASSEPDLVLLTTTLGHRPFFRGPHGLTVLAPHRLAEATLRRIVALAHELGTERVLAREVHDRGALALDRALARLGLRDCEKRFNSQIESGKTLGTHALYQCDTDKLVHLAVFTDALSAASIDGWWSTEDVGTDLVGFREYLPKLLESAKPPVGEWFTLVAVIGVGRDAATSVSTPAPGEPGLLVFPAADLETISIVEGRDPLLLWKYEEARREASIKTRFVAWSPLDEFAGWKQRSYSFLDDGSPTLVFQPGLGASLHEQAVSQQDWHAIRAPERERTVEVVLAESPHAPIYVRRGGARQYVQVAVDLGELVIWVVSNQSLDNLDSEHRALLVETARMSAYWLAQFGAHLSEEFADLGRVHHVVLINMTVTLADEPPPSAVGYVLNTDGARNLHVRIHKQFVESYDDTNEAERLFALNLTKGVLSLSHREHASAADRCLDQVAPRGVKRMMHGINTGRMPEFIGRDKLPPPRYPFAGDLIRTRRRLLGSLPLPLDTVSGNDAHTWLNKAVKTLYLRLREHLNRLDARSILSRLLLANESLVHEDALRDLTLASQLACYGRDPAFLKRIQSEPPRHASASLATRFLIEHVVAEPPSGAREASDLEVDELLALAVEIIALGVASDIAKFELADVRLRLYEADLVIDDGSYASAAQGLLLATSEDEIARASARSKVPRAGRKAPADEPSDRVLRLDAATEAEFGVSLKRMAELTGELLNLAQEQSEALVVLPRCDLVQRLGDRLSWQPSMTEKALSVIELSPRDSYPVAPEGMSSSDIWPWRFNRSLSYIRRPLVVCGDRLNRRAAFTPGHVHRASMNLLSLITTGRLKARTPELARVMGEFTLESSEALVEEVAYELKNRGFRVKANVWTVDGEPIADEDRNSLGDIDVLCADAVARRLYVIECKDFRSARMPHEVSADLNALFVSGKRRSAQDKHLRRVEWVQARVSRTIAWMGLEASAEWSLSGAFAFSTALISPLLGHRKLPVWTLHEIKTGTAP